MTTSEIINLVVMVFIAAVGIYWGVKNQNRTITHDNEKEIWKAVHENKKNVDSAIAEIKDSIKADYWDSSRTKEYYDLRTDMKIDHLESKINSLETSLGTMNTKLDIIVSNMTIKE